MRHKKIISKPAAWMILIITLLLTIYFLRTIRQNARMETDLDEYMPKDHPAFVYSDQAEEWFDLKDGILIAIENKQGIYNEQTLRKIKDLTKELQEMDEFEDNDVISLYTADNITGSEYGLEVRSFYKRVPAGEKELITLRENVRGNDMVFGRLVSEDETVGLVVAGMNDDVFSEEFYHTILEFARSYESDTEAIYVAGRPVVEGTMALLGPADMKRMVPVVLIVISVVLYLLLRSKRAATATLASVFISTIWAFGLMSAFRIPVYSVSTMIPVMLIAIGVAYGIYYYNHLNRFFHENQEASRYDAVRYVFRVLTRPLTMAAFTTMIGFISLLTSQVYPIKYFGLFTAYGILIAFLMALLFLPATVILFGYRSRKPGKRESGDAKNQGRNFTDRLLLHKRVVYLSVFVILVLSVIGIQRVWINSSFLDKFEKDDDIVLTDAFINRKFGGTSTLNIVLESDFKDAFKQPEILHIMNRMQEDAEKLQNVGNSFSLADYLKRMNFVMNADQPEFHKIPETSDMVAQYLLLYEMSGDPANLARVSNYDYNRTNLTFQLKSDDSKTIQDAIGVMEGYRDQLQEKEVDLNYAGSGYKALVFTDLILNGQIMSLGISLLLVIILLTVMFKNLLAGLIGTVPIMITALISFGIMGLFNIPLSTTTALLSSIAIGIGIDYAIHFLQHYRMNLKTNDTSIKAMYATMGQTGKAILFNAVVVIAGFLVLLFSVFPPNRALGALVSMNMFTSLAGTLSIMMVLVYGTKLFMNKKKKTPGYENNENNENNENDENNENNENDNAGSWNSFNARADDNTTIPCADGRTGDHGKSVP